MRVKIKIKNQIFKINTNHMYLFSQYGIFYFTALTNKYIFVKTNNLLKITDNDTGPIALYDEYSLLSSYTAKKYTCVKKYIKAIKEVL